MHHRAVDAVRRPRYGVATCDRPGDEVLIWAGVGKKNANPWQVRDARGAERSRAWRGGEWCASLARSWDTRVVLNTCQPRRPSAPHDEPRSTLAGEGDRQGRGNRGQRPGRKQIIAVRLSYAARWRTSLAQVVTVQHMSWPAAQSTVSVYATA